MKSLQETRDRFVAGELSKPQYIQDMYQFHHGHLFDYAKYLSGTDIESIEICDDQVVMKSRKYGVRMICPAGDQRVAPIEALNFLSYEEKDANMLVQLVPEQGVMFDVGANMGWYSLIVANRYKGCRVFAFEPLPKTHSFLTRNVTLNRLDNIYVHNFGLSNEQKDLIFYYYPEGSGNASLVNLSDRSDAELVTCHVKRLDDFVRDNELSVDFIKCDVEGAELFVFQGGLETLQKDKPVVFTEMLRKWSAKFDYHPNEIIELFSSLGYRCFAAQGDCLKEFLAMDDSTVETNFFFLHASRHRVQINRLVK